MNLASLGGSLTLRLKLQRGQVAGMEIYSTRPQAARLLEGKTPQQAEQLAPLLFSLCGGAQGVAAQAAVQAAQAQMPDAIKLANWSESVRREAALEHLWHLMLDWPSMLGLARLEKEYAICRQQFLQAKTDRDLAAALEKIVASGLLGMPVTDWLIQDQPSWAAWRENSSSFGATLLRRLEDADHIGESKPPLLPVTTAKEWLALEQQIRTAAFCSVPTWHGEPRETGALARQPGHALVAPLLEAGRTVEARLTARMVELSRWACGETETAGNWIDAVQCGEHAGLARVETARGVLIHRAQIKDGVISEYAIVAPTEWNFHPRGAFALEACWIAELDDASALRKAQLLALSLDPCVAYEVAHQ